MGWRNRGHRDGIAPDARQAGERSGPPTTAFVLAGGASHGALQAGMLRALYERSIVPDLIVGTSAGGLNAAFIATRPPTVATAEALADVWRGLHREDVFPIQPRALLRALANHRDHLISDSGLRRVISRHLEIEALEQAAIPLHLVSFDLHDGREVRLSTGSALEAILATSAIPGVLPPVRHGTQLLVDGGVVNNTPISHAVALGAERIYVMATDDLSSRALPQGPRSALDAAVHAFTVVLSARLEADLERFASAAELVVLPAVNARMVQPTDFSRADDLIEAALGAARGVLDGLPAPGVLAGQHDSQLS